MNIGAVWGNTSLNKGTLNFWAKMAIFFTSNKIANFDRIYLNLFELY